MQLLLWQEILLLLFVDFDLLHLLY